jgi:tRNA threonylcarbamoyladenosine biosynthesis protein TsaB
MLVAIETATDLGSVALGAGGDVAGEVLVGTRSRHAEVILPALEFLLRSLGLARQDLSGVVVGGGPGSFTGVRVAAATARGLAHGLGVPLYAYSSLAAAAATTAVMEGPVCPMFDARRGEVYAACYRLLSGGAVETVLPPWAAPVEEVLERVAALAPRFVGEGAIRYAARLGIEPPWPVEPRASALLRIAAADLAGPGAGRVHDLAGWEPDYVRASGAERGIAG